MTRTSVRSVRAAGRVAVVAAALAAGACADPAEIVMPPEPTGGAIFARYVALGNSITMGFQSGGVNDSLQRRSFAYLFAQQVGTPFAIPALAMPGCPPPIENFQTLARVGGATSTGATCLLRTPAPSQQGLNNVAWYGAFSFDAFTPVTTQAIPYPALVLGGRTQVERALELDPTFATVWFGNNDVLVPAQRGVLTPVPGSSPGVTPVPDFTANLDRILGDLVAGAPQVEGALFSVVNVTNAPTFFPAAALFNPDFKRGFEAFTGRPVELLATCTPTTASLLNFIAIVPAIRSGQHPAMIGCEKNSVPGTAVGDLFVLDAAELASLATTVAAYNAAIEAKADALGWAYVDVNPSLQELRRTGGITVVPNLASPTAIFGEYMSLDGTHPGNKAHVLVTNLLIDAVNATYGTSVPKLPAP